MVQTHTPYRVKGVFLETCNCDAGCNCNFGGFPDHGPCEALVGIMVNEGTFGDTDLSGVKVVLAVKWPKAAMGPPLCSSMSRQAKLRGPA